MSSRPYVIRPWRPEDAPGVREVLGASYGSEATPPALYDWWSMGIGGNPAGFMVAEAGGRVVGVQPMQWFRYADGGKEVRGGVLTGVAVHPDFRRLGIFTALVRSCEELAWRNGLAFVGTMPNERSRPGFLKAGYVDLGRRTLLMRALRAREVAGRKVPWLGTVAGGLLEAAQSLAKPVAPRGRWQSRLVNQLPAGLEQLAAAHAQAHPGLGMVRDGDWCRWRYLRAPGRDYLRLEVRKEDDRLAGFAVLALETRGGLRMGYLMDILVDQRSSMGPALREVFDTARNAGAEAISAVCSAPTLIDDLRAGGFVRLPFWTPLKRFYSVVRFAPGLTVPDGWRSVAGWNLTLGDWDNL